MDFFGFMFLHCSADGVSCRMIDMNGIGCRFKAVCKVGAVSCTIGWPQATTSSQDWPGTWT
jgi:hypothetical protein